MTFHVLTLFPEMILEATGHSIIGRAVNGGIIHINPVNIRDFAVNKHGQVDDAPYGGGAGMVLMAPPVFDAYEFVLKQRADINNTNSLGLEQPPVIYLSPQGKPLTQSLVANLAKKPELIILCGHYEGVDERVVEEIVTMEISIGDYVLSGGEVAAIVLIDSVSRLVPGVLGKSLSHINESFSGEFENMLEHPHYTRPSVFRGREVPKVLLSGHHGEIEKWRLDESKKRTKKKRPDLINES